MIDGVQIKNMEKKKGDTTVNTNGINTNIGMATIAILTTSIIVKNLEKGAMTTIRRPSAYQTTGSSKSSVRSNHRNQKSEYRNFAYIPETI